MSKFSDQRLFEARQASGRRAGRLRKHPIEWKSGERERLIEEAIRAGRVQYVPTVSLDFAELLDHDQAGPKK